MTQNIFKLDGEALIRIGEGLAANESDTVTAEALGITVQKLRNVKRAMGVNDDRGGRGGRRITLATQRRFAAPTNRGALVLAREHPSVVEGRTLFRNGDIRDPAKTDKQVLISGHNNPKLGAKVLVGRYAGRHIYHLSLEERATCPRSCEQWRSCYGNGMHRAARHVHGAALEEQLRIDVAALCKKHRRGILVRLHTLGDFYSLEYVRLWAELLNEHPKLACWGYTRRRPDDEDGIGEAIRRIRETHWSRFAIRFSNKTGERNSFVLKGHTTTPRIGDAFVCKQEWASQNGDLTSINCGNCAACWERDESVCFVEH